MNGRNCLLACLSVLLLVTAGLAQDEPVTLRYKHYTAGETVHFQVTASGVMPMTVDLTNAGEGQAGMLAMDMNITTDVLVDELCRSVDDQGVASVEMTIPQIISHNNFQQGGQPIDTVFEWKDGAITNAVNGTAVPETEEMRQAKALLSSALKMRVEPNGKTTPDADTVVLLEKLTNANGGMGGLDMGRMNAMTSMLPDHPVKVGDTWAYEDEAKAMGLNLKTTSTFKLAALEQFEGRRVARIEGHATLNSTGQADTPQAPAPTANTAIFTRIEVTTDFVNYFDLEKSCVVYSKMTMVQNMAMMITQPAKPGAAPVCLPATIDNGQMTSETRLK